MYIDIEKRRDDIRKLIDEVGTPVTVCEKDHLIDRFEVLDKALEQCWPTSQIAYSFKTNYDVAKSGVFQEMGAFAEVVSGREYALARELGYPGRNIIYNGPYKDDQSLRGAVEDGAVINVNDPRELERIVQLSASRRKVIPIGIRLSSTLDSFGHSRFGLSLEDGEATEVVEIIERAEFVDLIGLHSHVYGDTDDEKIYATVANRVGEFARDVVPNFGKGLRFLNMGGGFPANTPKPHSRESWCPKNIDVYVRAIADSLRRSFDSSKELPTLVLEPGRYLVNDAIILITKIIHVFERKGKQMVNTNGSISMVPLTHYRPQVIQTYSHDLEARSNKTVPSIVYGATCRENDILFEGGFPYVSPGDILIHFGVGAYNSSLSPEFIFHPPEMVLI
jgi:diaminopimelate decarboxylase